MSLPVSVVIPFYRNPAQLRRALNSVALQRPQPLETIVVSDASSEPLAWVEQDFEATRVIQLPQNRGPGYARNVGVQSASGDYVAFLDSDDWWYPTKLSSQLTHMDSSNAAWSHHPYDVVTDAGHPLRRITNEDLFGDVRVRALTSFRVQTSCMMFRRSVFVSDDCWFSTDRIGEDGALYTAVAKHHLLHRTPFALSAFVSHGSNAGASPAIQLWSRGKFARDCPPNEWQHIPRLARIAYRWADLASQALSLSGASAPQSGYRPLATGIAYTPAWALIRMSTRTPQRRVHE